MHAVVSIKQVPDTSNVRINPETGTLIREGVPAIVNPYDAHALELAVAAREAERDREVLHRVDRRTAHVIAPNREGVGGGPGRNGA